MVQQIDDPSLMADRAGYASYLTAEQKLTLLETADVTERLAAGDRVDPRAPGRAGRRRDDPQGRRRGHGEAAEGVPAPPAARRRPQGAERAHRRQRRDRGRGLPGPRRGGRPAGEGPRDGPEGSRQAGAHPGRVAGDRLDPHLARHDPGHPVERADRGRLRHRRRARACSTRTTPGSTTSRTGSSSTSPSASAGRTRASASSAAAARGRCSPWSGRPASARPRSASPSPARWAASSSGSRWAACGTRPRSAATGAPTWARCPAASSGPSARRAR